MLFRSLTSAARGGLLNATRRRAAGASAWGEAEATKRKLRDVQSLAHIGSWEWDLASDSVTWSDELYRMYGRDPASFEASYEAWLDAAHPDDLEMIKTTIATAFESGEPYQMRHRVVRPDGEVRWLHCHARMVGRLADGRPALAVGTANDITDLIIAEQVASDAEQRFRGLLETAPDAIVIVDESGAIQLVNAQTEQLLGYSREELLGKPVEMLMPARFRAEHVNHRQSFHQTPGSRPMGEHLELHALRKDGTEIPVEISLGPLETEEGVLVSAAIRNVSERRRADELHRRLAAIVEHTDDAVIAKTPDGVISEWNRGAERLYGYTAEEVIGRPVELLVPAERAGDEQKLLQRVIAGGEVEHYETVRLRKDGSRADVSLTISPIRDTSGRIVAASTIARDISERKRFEGQLKYLADHDSLTGLFNRRRFEAELERELGRAHRYEQELAILAVDLDHFKYINDTLGHSFGDELITHVSRIFRRRLRDTDIVARLGGDEFAIILPGADRDAALSVAASLLHAVRREGHVESPNGPRKVTASIGIAHLDHSTPITGEELVVEADIAMYDAKEAGRDGYATYSATENRHQLMNQRLAWAERIRRALDEDRFVLHAQPILALGSDPTPWHELLVRMIGENGEIIPPAAFLYVAERFDLIQAIDRWVLREAIELLATQQQAGESPRLAVNLSGKSIVDPELPALIESELQATGADPQGLCIEITESAAIVNVDRAKQFGSELARLGCQLALDDFGAGFASFYYLKHLDFDYLKVDGEFITGLLSNRTNQLVVKSIVDIARGLGKHTVAEFVSDDETLEFLRESGIDHAQGFYIGKPLPFSAGDLARGPEHSS